MSFVAQSNGSYYSGFNRKLLLEITPKYQLLINNKSNDAISERNRDFCWKQIRDEYNSCCQNNPKTEEDLRAFYKSTLNGASNENVQDQAQSSSIARDQHFSSAMSDGLPSSSSSSAIPLGPVIRTSKKIVVQSAKKRQPIDSLMQPKIKRNPADKKPRKTNLKRPTAKTVAMELAELAERNHNLDMQLKTQELQWRLEEINLKRKLLQLDIDNKQLENDLLIAKRRIMDKRMETVMPAF